MQLEVVAEAERLHAIRPAWEALWSRVDATPFSHPAWLLPWWRQFGSDELLAFASWEEGRLTGLLPLYVLREAGVRKLLTLGIGISDYLDPLVEAGAAPVLLAAVAEHAARFDRCELHGLRPGSPLLDAAGGGWARELEDTCPVLALPPGAPPFSAHRRRRLAAYRRRAEGLGRVELRAAEPGEVPELLAALARNHAARWQAKGQAGVMADPKVTAFHAEAAPALVAAGLLHLHALRLDGRAVAVVYALRDASRAHLYLHGFEPELQHLALGTLVMGHAIEEAARAGLGEVHFLRGDEPYKYDWGALDRRNEGLAFIPGAA